MAALQIARRQVGDVSVLDLWGQITMGEPSETFRDEIKRFVEKPGVKLLLHMGGVHQIDSSGLGSLVAAFTHVQRCGGQLKLVQLSEGLQNLMVVTKLLTVFDVYETEQKALDSFRGEGP